MIDKKSTLHFVQFGTVARIYNYNKYLSAANSVSSARVGARLIADQRMHLDLELVYVFRITVRGVFTVRQDTAIKRK